MEAGCWRGTGPRGYNWSVDAPPTQGGPSCQQQPAFLAGPVRPVRPTVTGNRSGDQLRAQFASLDLQRRSALQHASSYQVEMHKKYSLAFSCLVFVLIGGPIALRFPRGGMGLGPVLPHACVLGPLAREEECFTHGRAFLALAACGPTSGSGLRPS